MKDLSVIIPIHNEEEILENEIRDLMPALEMAVGRRDYEVLLVENGSSDQTFNIASRLAAYNPKIRVIAMTKPDYGGAMKEGILRSRGQYTAIFNIDFWDIKALIKAFYLFENEKKDVIVCSKTMKGSKDLRPLKRRIITRIFNFILRALFDYRGTDTHGIKFFRTAKMEPIVRKCWTDGGMLDTEFMLRAQYSGLQINEIPVICRDKEKRKSFFGIAKHGPGVLKDLLALFIELRLKA